jgi:mannose-6-phosphate isomerase
MLYPLLFQPLFMERIWGGRELERLYQKHLPRDKKIGESWEICDRPDAQSVVLNGEYAGKTLHDLILSHRQELMGDTPLLNGRFPLLVKILDAREKLSLQVHPPEQKAAALNGEPKTEIWYITQADAGAELYVGLKKGVSRAAFEEGINNGTVADSFHRVPVGAGDVMFLPSGRVHAIGAGLVLFEIQQNSDTTYRVFDWNRVDEQGRGRQLHIKESLECIDFDDFEPGSIRPEGSGIVRLVVNDPLFSVYEMRGRAGEGVDLKLAEPRVLAVASGEIMVGRGLGQLCLKAGGFCLLPAVVTDAPITFLTDATVLMARPGHLKV